MADFLLIKYIFVYILVFLHDLGEFAIVHI